MTTVLWMILGVLASYGSIRAFLAVLKRLARIEARLDTIESRDGEFDGRVLKLVPPPVERVYDLGVYLDKNFWLHTLRATPEEVKYLKESQRIFIDDLLDDEKCFPYNLHLTVEVWRGGLERVWFEDASNKPWLKTSVKEFRFYPTFPVLSTFEGTVDLWKCWLSEPSSEMLSSPTVQLCFDWRTMHVSLNALNGRFGSYPGCGVVPCEPTEDNVYLGLSLNDFKLGEREELSQYRRPDESAKEISPPERPYKAKPWATCYQNIDKIRGVRWRLWVQEPEKYPL